ncbi:aminoglycoside 6'-N-acetyltransferase [Ruminococcus sp.]|uniref:aminoglycoside 6'-N-acetyltransferase n=1 Tax=Ruminococcus sp. TaxID=41978 RepID=UPI0025ED9752|nr:aminoglycoside 6'-N-acetyltransferase [Ruminococcus sp.]
MIKKAAIGDAEILAMLSIKMWPDHDPDELAEEFSILIRNIDAACFFKYIDNRPVAFAQCQLRHDYVEGTNSSPVGYLEGRFVSEEYRRKGYAAELLEECEKWAQEKGCLKFASDCELNNTDSMRFHMANGFKETNRIICFKKNL